MARIIAPNKQYAGVSAGVPFTGGEGNTDNEYLLKWFRDHGYEVIEEPASDPEDKTAGESSDKLPKPADSDSGVAPAQQKGREKEG